jgi:hypothetical protein
VLRREGHNVLGIVDVSFVDLSLQMLIMLATCGLIGHPKAEFHLVTSPQRIVQR